jgi:hypothetical protein
MDEKYRLVLGIIGVAAAMILALMLIAKFDQGKKVYHCDLAEISPDFPIKAKEACRKLRTEK